METKMMISAVISGAVLIVGALENDLSDLSYYCDRRYSKGIEASKALGISCNERQSYKWIASLSYWQKKLSTH